MGRESARVEKWPQLSPAALVCECVYVRQRRSYSLLDRLSARRRPPLYRLFLLAARAGLAASCDFSLCERESADNQEKLAQEKWCCEKGQFLAPTTSQRDECCFLKNEESEMTWQSVLFIYFRGNKGLKTTLNHFLKVTIELKSVLIWIIMVIL